jgi:PhnB protein
MTQSPKDRSFLPHGWSTVTPRIVVRGARQLVDFLVGVFNASGEFQEDRPSVVWLDESPIMVSEAGIRAPMPAFLYAYVADTDGTYRRAVEAGARVVEEPFDTPYGDRRCMIEDAWGNTWQIATAAREVGR